MNLLKKFFFILIFLSLSVISLKSEENVSYVDIDFILTNTIAGKELFIKLKKEEELKINKFRLSDDALKNEEKKILAKKNLISKEEINKEIKILQVKLQNYKKEKRKEIEEFNIKRNEYISNFLKQINPIIEKYMADNSIYMLIDKKNIFIANKQYDITNNLIELINNEIKNIEPK